ncbi:cytochrome protein [Byssothecium circinans]|uniref:Cytochrome protein n=1 Tax=Byssothecium circinans TaxID=147558 RepID=A0A6A5U9I7_9PLEO|nr:cytochrome protein [Byssothecium circinans]
MPDVFSPLSKEFNDESDSLFYMDLWPFIGPMMMVSTPNYALQACQQTEFAVDRPDDLLRSMHAITGGSSIFATNGPSWKEARNILQPGFNSGYILGQTGHVVDEAETLVKILREKARKNEIFQLDHVTVKYMMNISGVVTLNRSLHSQTKNHPFASAMRNSLEWHYFAELKSSVVKGTPLLRLISWYNSRLMNNYLSAVLDERYADWRSGSVSLENSKSATDLILAHYISKHKDKAPTTLDAKFKKWAIPQLRIMFFVGHDSSAATVCYVFYLLSKNPTSLEKLRTEHDEVFGADVSAAPDLLRTKPQLLNKLSYTTAVIKEVLRLFPPASGFRVGRPGISLHNNGKSYPTENTRVWVLHSVLHRNPKYWKDPDEFIPERFLVGPEDPLYPVKGAWRPFEHGPRDCIGQTLAMSQLRISMVMLIRSFDVKPAYEEWDQIHGIPKLRICTFGGERAYQIGQSGGHPADGFPCRISVRV